MIATGWERTYETLGGDISAGKTTSTLGGIDNQP